MKGKNRNNLIKKNELCEGCRATCYEFLGHVPVYHDPQMRCPCITCLVKPICEDICNEYHRFEKDRKKITNDKRSGIYRRISMGDWIRLAHLNPKDKLDDVWITPA